MVLMGLSVIIYTTYGLGLFVFLCFIKVVIEEELLSASEGKTN